MRRLLLALVFAAPAALAQPTFTAEASVDQETYAYGEVITARFVVRNESGETATLWGSDGCAPYIQLGTLRTPGEASACTQAEVPYVFDARESVTWVWTLDPVTLGVPDTDGPQTVRMNLSGTCGLGEYGQEDRCAVRDSASFQAPLFLGGPLRVFYDPADADSVRSLKQAYGATVRDSTTRSFGVEEGWTVSGMTLPRAIAALDANDVIESVYPDRTVAPSEVFSTSASPRPAPALVTLPAPNPTGGAASFTVRPAQGGHVTVDLVDLLGRRVAVLHDGPLEGGAAHRFVVAAGALPAGVYVVRVSGAGARQTRRVVVAR